MPGRGRPIILGTRGSSLALVQTEEVLQGLRGLYPEREFRAKVIKSMGDLAAEAPLATLGKGVFTRELEAALLSGEVDGAVHSLKDLPGVLPEGLVLAAFPPRADARDVLVSKSGQSLATLPAGSCVGTSSPRRAALVKALRPDLETRPIRGNVDTRVRKVLAGQYDALVLAAAGLIRLGRQESITEYLVPELFVPAVGQGCLAVETREDEELVRMLQPLDHEPTRLAVTAERSFLKALGGGCQVPFGAWGTVRDGAITLWGVIAAPDGRRVYRDHVKSPAREVAQAEEAGRLLVQQLLDAGAGELIGAEAKS
ncbi:MAG: hydroxymethylbilane synthase [Chloroflexi bacterium]|nr:hydroxymethylbilane synthase [Chloroflexota bacterium]